MMNNRSHEAGLFKFFATAFIPFLPTINAVNNKDPNLDRKFLISATIAFDIMRLIPLYLAYSDLINKDYVSSTIGLATYAILGVLTLENNG